MAGTRQPHDASAEAELGDLVAELASHEHMARRERGRAVARLAQALAPRLKRSRSGAPDSGRSLADLLLEVAPRIPLRDLQTLRRHHDGLTGEALADALVHSAVRLSGAVGAAAGGLAAVQFTAAPTLLAAPVQLAAETLAVVAIEVKLVAELHEVYDVHVPGTRTQRASSFVSAWARRRGVDPWRPDSWSGTVGAAARRDVRTRVVRRLARNLSTLGPVLLGAVAGAGLNRRETQRLATAVRRDLRRRVDNAQRSS